MNREEHYRRINDIAWQIAHRENIDPLLADAISHLTDAIQFLLREKTNETSRS
jgi:HD superfamily phosphodiesterase